MNTKVSIENKGKEAIFISGKMLLPGDSREFDRRDVPAAYLQPEPKEEKPEPTLKDRLLLILAGNVASVIAALPELNDDELLQLGNLEGEGARRVSIGRAVDGLLMDRANAKLEAEQAAQRAEQLAQALTDLRTATEALDTEGDTDKHPALQAAVDEAKARVEALTPQAQA